MLAFEGKHESFAGALEWIAEFYVPRVGLPSDMYRTGGSSTEKVRSDPLQPLVELLSAFLGFVGERVLWS